MVFWQRICKLLAVVMACVSVKVHVFARQHLLVQRAINVQVGITIIPTANLVAMVFWQQIPLYAMVGAIVSAQISAVALRVLVVHNAKA